MSRAVVAPYVPFAMIDAAARSVGLRGGPTTALPPLVPGEPELAEWWHEDVLVSYSFDPTVSLRVLSADGDRPGPWGRLTARLVVVDEAGVRRWLDALDEEDLVRGILAVEALQLAGLIPRIDQLRGHASTVVAAVAARTVGRIRP